MIVIGYNDDDHKEFLKHVKTGHFAMYYNKNLFWYSESYINRKKYGICIMNYFKTPNRRLMITEKNNIMHGCSIIFKYNH